MSETPKERLEQDKQKKDAPDEASWGEDQKKREYYYDDSYGYEVYTPDQDDDDTKPEPQPKP